MPQAKVARSATTPEPTFALHVFGGGAPVIEVVAFRPSDVNAQIWAECGGPYVVKGPRKRRKAGEGDREVAIARPQGRDRLGRLGLGEGHLDVRVGPPHRGERLELCRW